VSQTIHLRGAGLASVVKMRRASFMDPADCLSEPIDNSIEYDANKIEIVLDRRKSRLTVSDNGRGNSNIRAFFQPTEHVPYLQSRFRQSYYGMGCFDAMVTMGSRSTVVSCDGQRLRSALVDWESAGDELDVKLREEDARLAKQRGLLGPTGTKIICDDLHVDTWGRRATPKKLIDTLQRRFWPVAEQGITIELMLDDAKGNTVEATIKKPTIPWSHGYPHDEQVSLCDGRVIRVVYGLIERRNACSIEPATHIVRGNARVVMSPWFGPTNGAVNGFMAIVYLKSSEFTPDVWKSKLTSEDLDVLNEALRPLFKDLVSEDAGRAEYMEVRDVSSRIEDIANAVFGVKATRAPKEKPPRPPAPPPPAPGPAKVFTWHPKVTPGTRRDATQQMRGFRVSFSDSGRNHPPVSVSIDSRQVDVAWNRSHSRVQKLYEKSRNDPEYGAWATWGAFLTKLSETDRQEGQLLLPGMISTFHQFNKWIRADEDASVTSEDVESDLAV
jgi:hypothetical protein